MGFRVLGDGHVTVDHTIDGFCNTRITDNPTICETTCGMSVHSIFLRRSHFGKKIDKGDNCPLIYALKKRENLYTNFGDIKILLKTMPNIIDKFVSGKNYDLVIAMPSSHKIAYILARRVCRRVVAARVSNNAFRKITVAEARLQIKNIKMLHDIRSAIDSNLKRQERAGVINLSLKDIKTEHRKFFSPVVLVDNCQIFLGKDPERILLVDDLFSTGATLIVAKDQLSKVYPNAHIDALCLFSPLNGKIKKR